MTFVACVAYCVSLFLVLTMSASEEDLPVEVIPKKRKKGLKQVVYKSEMIKSARVEGKEYVNYRGVKVKARIMGEPCR